MLAGVAAFALIAAVGALRPAARRRHRPARRQRLERLPRDPGLQAEVRRRRGRRPGQGRSAEARPHLRPRHAALARGLSVGQRSGRQGLHRRAGAGAVRRDRRAEPVHALLGGATFLNQSAIQAGKILKAADHRRCRRRLSRRPSPRHGEPSARVSTPTRRPRPPRRRPARSSISFRQQIIQLGDQVRADRPCRALDDPTFVSAVVFDSSRPGEPKPRFSIFWPSAQRGADPDPPEARPDRGRAPRRDRAIRAAVADPAFAIRNADYVVSGVPVVVQGLSDELSGEIFILLAAALIVMTLTLALIFGPPLRLLPLGDRARLGGAHLRPARALRRLVDDGLARGPADPDRARGRLRDPIPGPLHRGP